jgi:hypothetical protein
MKWGKKVPLGLLNWKGERQTVDATEGEGAVRGKGTEVSVIFRQLEQEQ